MSRREELKRLLVESAKPELAGQAEIIVSVIDEIFDMKDAIVSIADSLKRLADYHVPTPKSQPAAHRSDGARAEPPVPGM